MSVIGEAALSALFQGLFEKIASSDLLKFVSEKEIRAEIKKWESMLLKIHDVLDDAEEKQMVNRYVKRWLDDLHDLAYDVEDVLDEFATESLRRKLKGERQASTGKVRQLIPSCCTNFSPSAIMFNSEMASKIKEITARLQDVTIQRDTLELRVNVGGISGNAWKRPPTTCLHDEPQVHGRDEDKRQILHVLTTEDATDAKIGVLPIVGMGGLGKTTLARHIFNDESLQQHFHQKAWVCVSGDFDIMRITKAILESITKRPSDLKELNQVQLELQKELAGKKFLIVLDDVWSECYEDWNALRPPFMDGARGSRMIVTTRSKVVALNMGTVEFHALKHLSDDECWLIFRRHAFENRSIGAHPNEEIIRTKVITKCAGLPLAARTLGGLLRSKPGDKWDDILNSKIWSFDDSEMLPVLRLSYHHLPSHLKRCFSYCAIIPKDYEFTEMEIVLLWMAEGLIQQMDDGKQMEDVGIEYFHDLLSRSLFQAASSGGSKFIMHDLVNDLAQRVAGETCLRLEDKASAGSQLKSERVRHSCCILGEYDGISKFQALHKTPHLRTFLPLALGGASAYLTNDVVSNLLPKLRCLRVLSFKGYEIFELPDSIGDLKHLRYLDLSFTAIRSLPKSIIFLCNLQSLILRECSNLMKLPSRMEGLINLRHLDIEGARLEEGLPLGVKDLASLRTLSNISVGKGRGAGLTALKKLKYLRGELSISGLENINNGLHGREANLKEKKDLRTLSLNWEYDEIGDERYDAELLNGLQPHVDLAELIVRNYGGISFPIWVWDSSFLNLVALRLQYCIKCSSLPKLGLLPSLRELHIEGMSNVKRVGAELYGEGCSNPFPALEMLCFKNMKEWEDWNPYGFKFPCLLELTIRSCPKLRGKIPSCLSKLKRLQILNCEELVICLPSLPVVSDLVIFKCKEVDFGNMVEFGSPNYVGLSHISKFTFPTEGHLEHLCKSKILTIHGELFPPLPNFREEKEDIRVQVEELDLVNCENFLHWAPIFIYLKTLRLYDCPKLVSVQDVSFSSTLRTIRISRCDALVSLPNAVCLEKLEIMSCDSLISIGTDQLPSTLKHLVINSCENLESIVLDKVQVSSSSGTNLEFLSVGWCTSLTSLVSSPRGELPTSLKYLEIKDCSNLKSIAESFSNLINLESFLARDCPSLISLLSSSGGQLPPNLKILRVKNCSKLELIAESFNTTTSTSLELILIEYCPNLRYLPEDLHKLIGLHEIHIIRCDSLVSFPQGGLPTNHLKELRVHGCNKLDGLPNNIHNITSLEKLSVTTCPAIVSFPEEGFPTNLVDLSLSDVKICKPLLEWGLHRLTTLTHVNIRGGSPDVVSFPCNGTGMMLPSSLVHLAIANFPKLEYLSTNSFQNLTSLGHLILEDCPRLAAFPKNGLPLSLLQLVIRDCPLLKQRCQKDKGQEWFKIAHIPCIKIDYISVFDPERWH